MIILMSLLISTNALTQENSTVNQLVLPEPQVLDNKVCFESDSYAIMLQIYATYRLHQILINDYQETVDLYEQELHLYKERLELKNKAILTLENDRDFAYKVMDKKIDEFYEERKKTKIRTILFTGGGILVGVGIGVIIGLFSSH